MDAAKLRNSCICGHSEPYAACCAPFAERPKPGLGPDALQKEFRHALHELHMHRFPLRMLYQQYWEKLGQDDYPHHVLMEDGEYGRAVVEQFFWDYSVQYSDARPILRAAREIEGRDLRLGHDLLQWSFAPLWAYYVVESGENEAHLRQAGHDKVHHVRHDGRVPPAGHGLWARLLPFRGHTWVGMARLATPTPVDPGHLDALLISACRDLRIKPTVSMRPDVHCDEWRRHGGVFLAQWRQMAYDSEIGRPARALASVPSLALPIPSSVHWAAELARHPKVRPLSDGRFEFRHRGLSLGRLEPRGRKLLLSLFDPAFAAAIAPILAPLGLNILEGQGESDLSALAGDADADAGTGKNNDPGQGEGSPMSASWDAWLHIPHADLGGQTPIQSSTHDFGRRRLKLLLGEMAKRGRDISVIERQLRL